MDWLHLKRRVPEWEQECRGQTMASISTPPLQLLTIFSIVILLLWFSQDINYQAQWHNIINFQTLVLMLPVVLLVIIASHSMAGRFMSLRSQREFVHGHGTSGTASPWGVALLVLMLLVLLSYRSSFSSKLFGS